MAGRDLHHGTYFGGGISINAYQELWALIRPKEKDSPAGLSGIITSLSPLTVAVRGEEISQGLLLCDELVLGAADIGRQAALLPVEDGLLLLCLMKEVEA